MSPLSLGFVYFCFSHFCLWGFLHFWDVLGIPAESACAEVSKHKKLIKSFSLPRIEHNPKCMEDWTWKKHSHKHRAQKVISLKISTSQNAPLLDLLYSSKFSYHFHPTPLRETSWLSIGLHYNIFALQHFWYWVLKFPGFEELGFRMKVLVTSKIMAKLPQTPKDVSPECHLSPK